jgi:hypothetical protein
MKTPARFPCAIGHAMESWASVAFFLRNGIERGAQPEVLLDIDTLKPR